MTRYNYTGDALTTGDTIACFRIPHAQQEWVLLNFMGVLDELSQSWAWVVNGETDASEAAEIFNQIILGMFVMPLEVGDIKNRASSVSPTLGTWLLCDGSQYNQSDYPELYTAIGSTWNTGTVPSGKFCVPDLVGRTQAMVDPDGIRIDAAFGHSLGGTGGEDTHKLITAELASHTHVDSGHAHPIDLADSLAVAPGEEPVTIPFLLGTFYSQNAQANLQNTGSDTPHNNMQPTAMIYSYILARL